MKWRGLCRRSGAAVVKDDSSLGNVTMVDVERNGRMSSSGGRRQVDFVRGCLTGG